MWELGICERAFLEGCRSGWSVYEPCIGDAGAWADKGLVVGDAVDDGEGVAAAPHIKAALGVEFHKTLGGDESSCREWNRVGVDAVPACFVDEARGEKPLAAFPTGCLANAISAFVGNAARYSEGDDGAVVFVVNA